MKKQLNFWKEQYRLGDSLYKRTLLYVVFSSLLTLVFLFTLLYKGGGIVYILSAFAVSLWVFYLIWGLSMLYYKWVLPSRKHLHRIGVYRWVRGERHTQVGEVLVWASSIDNSYKVLEGCKVALKELFEVGSEYVLKFDWCGEYYNIKKPDSLGFSSWLKTYYKYPVYTGDYSIQLPPHEDIFEITIRGKGRTL